MNCKRTTAENRFWSQVLVVDSCWEWIGCRGESGYGKFWFSGGSRNAYRWAYEHFRGPVPAGLEMDHLCRNRGCVNPDHLEAVSRRTNVLRGNAVTANNAAKTHCLRGHELSGGNLRTPPSRKGVRICRQCFNARMRAEYHARRAAGLPRKGSVR